MLDGEDDETIFSNFSFNGSGYISNYTSTEYWFYSESDKVENKAKVSISYNKTGQISKIVRSYNWIEYYEGDKFEDKGSETFSYTYKDGNLVQVINIGGDSDETWSYICEYEYDNVDNVYGQFTVGLTYCFMDLTLGKEFSYLGLFGIPSKELPIHLNCIKKGSWKDEDGDDHEYEDKYSYNLSYSYNDVGLISRERMNSYNFYYSYFDGTRACSVSENSESKASLIKRQHGSRRKINGRH